MNTDAENAVYKKSSNDQFMRNRPLQCIATALWIESFFRHQYSLMRRDFIQRIIRGDNNANY